MSDCADSLIGVHGLCPPVRSIEENEMTTTTDHLSSTSLTVAMGILERLDLRLLTLISAVSCAAGAVGLNC